MGKISNKTTVDIDPACAEQSGSFWFRSKTTKCKLPPNSEEIYSQSSPIANKILFFSPVFKYFKVNELILSDATSYVSAYKSLLKM